ncbi:hypothetical protein GJAV_G00062910 [Gymnothorax javanicus]|nr:hypothetical protein GJAV_G00062910 [Gymnothorax javanicus]
MVQSLGWEEEGAGGAAVEMQSSPGSRSPDPRRVLGFLPLQRSVLFIRYSDIEPAAMARKWSFESRWGLIEEMQIPWRTKTQDSQLQVFGTEEEMLSTASVSLEEFLRVTTLVNTSNKGPSSKKKGRSKKAHVLAVSVEQATQNFLEKGEQIAKDSQDLKEELIAAVDDVRKQGETMRVASSEFADDPCSSVKRGTMVRAARALLSAVTRLLILADMADVMRLLAHLKIVEEALEAVKNATNEQDLANRFKEFGKEMVKLNYVAARRQQELKDPQCRDEMAAARGALKKNATMLYTASQAFLRHPDVAATRANRDYVFKQVQEAIAGISGAAQASSPTDEKHSHAGIGELAAALNEFDNKIILDPLTFSEARFRPSLEERLESIISGAALMADSSCTRDDRRERIVAECNAVRQALQDLLSEYMNNTSPPPHAGSGCSTLKACCREEPLR